MSAKNKINIKTDVSFLTLFLSHARCTSQVAATCLYFLLVKAKKKKESGFSLNPILSAYFIYNLSNRINCRC